MTTGTTNSSSVSGSILPLIHPDPAAAKGAPIIRPVGPDVAILEPWLPGLAVVYGVERGDQYQLVTRRQCQDWMLRPATLRSLAVANLSRELPQVTRAGTGPAWMLTVGRGLEASLLLLDEVWDSQHDVVSEPIIAAAPARDVLFFSSLKQPGGLAALRSAVDRLHEGPLEGALCSTLFEFCEDGWQAVDELLV